MLHKNRSKNVINKNNGWHIKNIRHSFLRRTICDTLTYKLGSFLLLSYLWLYWQQMDKHKGQTGLHEGMKSIGSSLVIYCYLFNRSRDDGRQSLPRLKLTIKWSDRRNTTKHFTRNAKDSARFYYVVSSSFDCIPH